MAPPSYNDLGKCARDLFNNGYHFGLLSLNLKTKTKNGVEFTSGGNAAHDTGKVTSSLQSKYNVKKYGEFSHLLIAVKYSSFCWFPNLFKFFLKASHLLRNGIQTMY